MMLFCPAQTVIIKCETSSACQEKSSGHFFVDKRGDFFVGYAIDVSFPRQVFSKQAQKLGSALSRKSKYHWDGGMPAVPLMRAEMIQAFST